MKKSMLLITLILSLVLSACATAPKEEVVPESVAVPAVEQPAVVEPAVAPEVAPEPQAIVQEEAPKPVVKKKKRRVAKAAPAPVEVAPVVQPEPVVEPVPVVTPVQESPAPVLVAKPVTKVQEEGFLEKYWVWLLGIVIAVAVVLLLVRKKD